MSKIAQRRKIHSFLITNQQQDSNCGKNSSTYVSSTEEMKKTIKQLETMLRNEKQARESAEENLKMHQIRSLTREKQFYKILQQSDRKVRSFVKSSQSSNVVMQIKNIYQNILRNFEFTNEVTNSIIEGKYKQCLSALQRRADSILSTMNEELSNLKMLSSKSIAEIRQQIQLVINVSRKIQRQNFELRVKINQQNHKNKLLEEERKLLLEQVVNKKLLISKFASMLKKDIKQDKNHYCNRFSRQGKNSGIREHYSENASIDAKRDARNIGAINQFETKQTTPDKRMVFNEATIVSTSIQKHGNKTVELIKSKSRSEMSISSEKDEEKQCKRGKKYIKVLDRGGQLAQVQYKKLQKRYGKKLSWKKEFELNYDKSQNVGESKRNLREEVGQTSKNIIKHLNSCLEREKKKNAEYGKIISKTHNRNQQINELIFSVFQDIKTKKQDGLDEVFKCEKLFKLIYDMKKRLQMCQNPAVQPGWGDLDIQKFLTNQNFPISIEK